MENVNGLSILEQINPINETLDIIYTPSESIAQYSYEITRDGESYGKYNVTSNKATNIRLSETGKYQITITAYDVNNQTSTIKSGFYNIDVDRPIIVVNDIITLDIDTLKEYQNKEVTELDNYIKNKEIRIIDTSGDLIDKVESNLSEINVNGLGNYTLTYTVADEAGNVATKDVILNVVDTPTYKLGFFQYGIILLLFVCIIAFFRNRKSVMFETRISKYSVNPRTDTSLSLLDKLINMYRKTVCELSKSLSKSVFLEKYSKRYEKYIILYRNVYESETEFVANKLLVGIIFAVIAIFAKTIQYEAIGFYEIILILFLGFFIPDIVYFSKYKLYRKKLENDIFQAIIIMNNAFKSGRSITQAIDLVSTELDGQVSLEFQKMSLELSYGLGIDVVFKRLADRVQIEEVNYLTASLSILNRTGGNIIKVFSSIEKTLFSKKKLKLELASLTGSSKIIVYILFAVPLLFIVFISLINPSYFEPFYKTDIGIILMGIMIIIYIGYVWCVRKIMKVRM